MYKNYIKVQTLGDVGIGFRMSKLKNTIAATQLKTTLNYNNSTF